jgi:transposase InsO family protein
VTQDLKEEGETVGHNRVARIMKEHAIVGKPPKKFVITTDSQHDLEVAPNLLDREFEVDGPNQVWVGDITYLWTYRGWSYLATVIDLFGRSVVGWEYSDHMSADLVVRAFEKACAVRDVKPGLIFHSDRGSQYASAEFRKVLADHGAIASMSRKGNCWDNAVAESFFATIKRELLNRSIWMNLSHARAAIHEYIEVFYNRTRRHSANGNISPAAYERLYNKAAEAA